MWIDDEIPAAVGRYTLTSEKAEEYNCIAWAAIGVKDEWWEHTPGYKWPAPTRSSLVESLVAVFEGLGYERCDSDGMEPGYEKVALYARNGFWTHAAKQLPNGRWMSKLGPDEDIHHDTADCLCGNGYGIVHCYMKRKVANEQPAEEEASAEGQ